MIESRLRPLSDCRSSLNVRTFSQCLNTFCKPAMSVFTESISGFWKSNNVPHPESRTKPRFSVLAPGLKLGRKLLNA